MQSPIIAKSNDGEQSFHWAANLSNEKAAANNRAAAFLPAPEWRTNYISEMPETAAFDWRLADVPHGPDFFPISSEYRRRTAEMWRKRMQRQNISIAKQARDTKG